MAAFVKNAACELYYDNVKKFETTSSGAAVTGSLGIGTASPLKKLHIVDSGDVALMLQTTNAVDDKEIFEIGCGGNASNHADLIFRTRVNAGSGGSEVFRLTNDGNVQVSNDAGKLQLGASQDLQIYHDGTDSIIDNSTGNLKIIAPNNVEAIKVFNDGTVNIGATADNVQLRFGIGSDLKIYHDGNHSFVENTTGLLILQDASGIRLRSDDLRFESSGGSEGYATLTKDGSVALNFDNSTKFQTTSYGNASTGQVRVTSSNASTVGFSLGDAGTGFYNTGSNAIGYSANGTQKWNINSSGSLTLLDNVHANFGTSSDLQIYHDGSFNFIRSENGHPVNIIKSTTENIAKFIPDGAVELYYDNVKRLATTGEGITVDGTGSNSFVLAGAMGANEQFKISNTSSGHYIQIGMQQQDTDGLHHRAYIRARKSTGGSIAGKLELLARGSGGGTDRGLFIDAANYIESSLNFIPTATNSYDLGSSSRRWRNIYTNDLNLSNEGSTNDVDGSWGDWTIQEGESDLFLKNNRSGKKYKFNLTEVS